MASTLDNIVIGSEHRSLDSDDENSQIDKVPVECSAADKGHLDCTYVCCSNEMEAYQPKQRNIVEVQASIDDSHLNARREQLIHGVHTS